MEPLGLTSTGSLPACSTARGEARPCELTWGSGYGSPRVSVCSRLFGAVSCHDGGPFLATSSGLQPRILATASQDLKSSARAGNVAPPASDRKHHSIEHSHKGHVTISTATLRHAEGLHEDANQHVKHHEGVQEDVEDKCLK